MNDAVFISDLHLNPNQPEITLKFRTFIQWAKKNTKSLYILGDFLHVWPGDDALNAWSEEIVHLLAELHAHHVKVYFMPGNRDFLIGDTFIRRARMQLLPEPAMITLGKERVLLAHGDGYCKHDIGHQWLRFFTRNRWFKYLFLCLPYTIRYCLVNRVRSYSQSNRRKPKSKMDLVPWAMFADIWRFKATALIHGHTHCPGLKIHTHSKGNFHQYTLSDWDESPVVLCYNKSKYIFSNVSGDRKNGY